VATALKFGGGELTPRSLPTREPSC